MKVKRNILLRTKRVEYYEEISSAEHFFGGGLVSKVSKCPLLNCLCKKEKWDANGYEKKCANIKTRLNKGPGFSN